MAVAAFAARGNQRNPLPLAECGKIVEQVGVPEETENEIAGKAVGYVGLGFIDQWRQIAGNGDDFDDFQGMAILGDAADFLSAGSAFLDNADAGDLLCALQVISLGWRDKDRQFRGARKEKSADRVGKPDPRAPKKERVGDGISES